MDDYDISDEKFRKIVGKSEEKSKLITCEMVMNYLENRGVLEETDETEFMRSLRKRLYYAIDTVVGPIPMKSKVSMHMSGSDKKVNQKDDFM